MTKLPWGRLAAEFVVIVTSVLVALGADSWNDGRLQRAEEAEYLVALRQDFDQTRTNIQSTYDYNTSVLERNVRFLGRLDSAPGSIPTEELQEFTNLAFRLDIFSPVLGTYKDMVNSGKLELIQSDSLRLSMAQFVVQYEVLKEVVAEGYEQWNGLQVPFLVEHSNVIDHQGGNYRGVELPAGVVEPRPAAYWSAEFANILTIAIISKRDILAEAEELMVWLDAVDRHLDGGA